MHSIWIGGGVIQLVVVRWQTFNTITFYFRVSFVIFLEINDDVSGWFITDGSCYPMRDKGSSWFWSVTLLEILVGCWARELRLATRGS